MSYIRDGRAYKFSITYSNLLFRLAAEKYYIDIWNIRHNKNIHRQRPPASQ